MTVGALETVSVLNRMTLALAIDLLMKESGEIESTQGIKIDHSIQTEGCQMEACHQECLGLMSLSLPDLLLTQDLDLITHYDLSMEEIIRLSISLPIS